MSKIRKSSLEQICSNQNGLSIEKVEFYNIPVMALLSLEEGLRSYFSTYDYVRGQLECYAEDKPIKPDYLKKYTEEYHKLYAKIIFHFQHFFELILKDFLRKDHLLLADKVSNHTALYDILHPKKGQSYSVSTSIEFRETLERICALIDKRNFKNGRLAFISNNKLVLDNLNNLRNRLVHKGTFILKFNMLDEFMCGHILPIVSQLMKLSPHNKYKKIWQPKPLECKLNLIESLIHCYETEGYNYKKINFIKELGRAAYQVPKSEEWKKNLVDLETDWFISLFALKNSEASVQVAYNKLVEYVNDPMQANHLFMDVCPVCGVPSMTIFGDGEFMDIDESRFRKVGAYTWSAECHFCSLHLYKELGNPSEHSLSLSDYWYREQAPITSSWFLELKKRTNLALEKIANHEHYRVLK